MKKERVNFLELSRKEKADNILKFLKEQFEKFKITDSYDERKEQSKYVKEFAQPFINATINNLKTGKDLYAFMLILGWSCTRDNFLKQLKQLKLSKQKEDILRKKWEELNIRDKHDKKTGVSGAYTATQSRQTLKQISKEGIKLTKEFLRSLLKEKNLKEIQIICSKFETKKIKFVKQGIYSPWVHYLQPNICPIVNKKVASFLKVLGFSINSNDYSDAIELYQTISEYLNEPDLGIIDSFIYFSFPEGSRNLSRLKKSMEDTSLLSRDVYYPQSSNNPLNLILFGPPGTGKTYKTKSIAVEIINGVKNE